MPLVDKDILLAFEQSKHVLALSLDIKGAFNSVRPDLLLRELRSRNLSSRLYSLINVMISSRNLYFSVHEDQFHTTGVGLPQGGVLSPILYNIYFFSGILEHIGLGARATIYVDDIFFTRSQTT